MAKIFISDYVHKERVARYTAIQQRTGLAVKEIPKYHIFRTCCETDTQGGLLEAHK